MSCSCVACLKLRMVERMRREFRARSIGEARRRRVVEVRRSVIVPSGHADHRDLTEWLRPLWFGGEHAVNVNGTDAVPVRVDAKGRTWRAEA